MLAKKAFYGLLWVMAEVAIAHPGIHEQIDVLNERLKKQPTYQLYAQRAHLYFEGGQTDLALKDLDLASKLGPKEPLLFEYGNANAAKGDHKRALQYFDQFIQFNNTFPEAYQARAHTLKQLGRDEDAIRDLKHSFGMRQAAPPGLYIEAANVIVSGKNKDFQAAIDLLDEGIKRLGVQGQLQERAIELLVENKKLTNAADRMLQLGNERNHNIFWRYDYALLLIQAGQKIDAQSQLRQALQESKGLDSSAIAELRAKIEKQLSRLK